MQMYAKDDIMKKLVDKAVVGLSPAVANGSHPQVDSDSQVSFPFSLTGRLSLGD